MLSALLSTTTLSYPEIVALFKVIIWRPLFSELEIKELLFV